MSNPTAILLLTCDRYIKVAELTLGLLRFNWQNSPKIYLGGVTTEVPDEHVIPFDCAQRDWMGIALQAAEELVRLGYEYCYLILDDHPPVARCNNTYLENDLPRLASDLRATAVSMVGWDQIRAFNGTELGSDYHFWLRNDPSYRWVFNLHPACWNLEGLVQILKTVRSTEIRENSARAFEARARKHDSELLKKMRESSFRVCGDRYSVDKHWFSRKYVRKILLYCLHGLRFSARLGGEKSVEKIDAGTKVYTDYINGPYPMFWSGLMRNGELHANAVHFLRLSGLTDFAKEADTLSLWP